MRPRCIPKASRVPQRPTVHSCCTTPPWRRCMTPTWHIWYSVGAFRLSRPATPSFTWISGLVVESICTISSSHPWALHRGSITRYASFSSCSPAASVLLCTAVELIENPNAWLRSPSDPSKGRLAPHKTCRNVNNGEKPRHRSTPGSSSSEW